MEKKPPKHGCGGDDCAHDDETCNFEVPSIMDHKTSDLTHVDDDTIHDPLLEALHSHNNYRTLLNSSPLAPSTSTDKRKDEHKDKDKHASPSIISSVFGSSSISISGHSHRHQPETDEITNSEYRSRTRTTFLNDAITFAEGTIPQSIVIAIVIGIVCGFVAFGYYYVLNYLLRFFWKDLPQRFVVQNEAWPEELYFLWIPLVSLSLSLLCGASIYYLGEPGDLAFTIQCVHKKAYMGTSHVLPMAAASLFSILAGGSLGPEAPLVAICAATAGFLSKKIFKQTNRNVVRKHTLM